MTRLFLIVTTLLPIALASYCGKSGVPYSFEVLESGAPVLGCAQPSCVISPEDFEEDSEFLTDANGQADGYFREGDRSLKRYRNDNAPKLVANCSGGFSQLSCPRKNQWVGGIEYIDHPRQPLILQCCSFDGLRFSQEVGMTVVNSGEAVTGGEVIRNGRQISFDVIANVRKIVQPGHGHKPSYEVTVRRMNCLPDPPEPQIEFDKDVPSEVLKVLSTAKNGKDLGTKEKFEKMSQQKPTKKQQKKSKKNQEAAFGAKQYAAGSQNSIAVDFNSGASNNLVPLPTAAPQAPRQPQQQQQQQPQPLPQAPQQTQYIPQQQIPQQPQQQIPQQPQQPQQPQPPQQVAAVPYQQPYPGFGAPAGGFPGFPAVTPAPAFAGFPTFPTFAPFGVTPAPLGAGFGTTTSTWDQAIANQPPRPTYPGGNTVFPTIGTAFMTPMPGVPTFAPFPGAAGAGVTPVPPVPARSGAPEHQQLPALATPPSLPQVEQQVNQQGSAAAVSAASGAGAGNGGAQAQGVSTAVQGGAQVPQQPAGGFPQQPQPQLFQHPNLPGFPPHQPFQPFTFPPHPPHPQFQFPAHPAFTFPGLPPHGSAAAAGSAGAGLQPPPTLPPMPTFSFPTLPPAAATTPHPLFTLPPHPHLGAPQPQQPAPSGQTYAGPAPPPSAASATGPGPQAQGAALLTFPAGVAPIQFPGLGSFGGSSS